MKLLWMAVLAAAVSVGVVGCSKKEEAPKKPAAEKTAAVDAEKAPEMPAAPLPEVGERPAAVDPAPAVETAPEAPVPPAPEADVKPVEVDPAAAMPKDHPAH